MPYYTEGRTVGWGQFLETEIEEYGEDIVLTSTGLLADTYGQKIVYPGTVIARVTDTALPLYLQGLVKVATATYGTGSNVAWGLLRSVADVTMGAKLVHLVKGGRVRSALVTDQGTTGTVQAGTKTALPHIEWV